MIGTISIEDVVKGVVVNGENVVDYDGIAKIIIPDPPEVPVKDVKVDGESVVDPQGDANIVIPVKDVKVDGESVIDSEGVANITIPDPPVKDVKVDGESVVNARGVANITIPEAPVKDVKVNGESVVNAQGVADVDVPVISNLRVVKQLPGVPAAVVTVSDAEAFTMPSLKVAIEAWQEGSGDPSTSNVRPIHGWDEVNVGVVGKNLVESTLANTTINTNGEINVSGGSSTFDMHIAKIIKGETYTIQSDESQNVNQKFVGGFFYDMPQLGSISYNNSRLANTPATFTAPIDGYVAFRTSHNYAFAQIEFGTTATTYEPYNGATYTIDLDGTRYGGRLEIINGVARFVATKEYIASYNGETLPSDWISDRDVYSEGATPTIGAEVVYTLATPTIIPLGNYPISTLVGVNNIFADSGDVLQGEYASNIKVVDIG